MKRTFTEAVLRLNEIDSLLKNLSRGVSEEGPKSLKLKRHEREQLWNTLERLKAEKSLIRKELGSKLNPKIIYQVKGLIGTKPFSIMLLNLESKEEASDVARYLLGQTNQSYIISSIDGIVSGTLLHPAI